MVTDDKLREACARALGFKKSAQIVRTAHGEQARQVWQGKGGVEYQSPPPLDGNTAVALLLLATDVASVIIDNPCYGPAITVRTYAPIRVHRFADKTRYTVILAALLALGQISEEDVSEEDPGRT